MVTIDKIIENVGKFNGNVSEKHRMYERAKQNVEYLEKDKSILKLEETLKKKTRYDDFNLPSSPDEYSITLGDVTFNVKSRTVTKRPQYKTAVEGMENYINGLRLYLSENRIITGVAKEENKTVWCISVDSLVQQYEIILSGVKFPGVEQKITYDASNINAPKDLRLASRPNGKLTEDNFVDYVMKDLLLNISKKYVKAYEKELEGKKKIEGLVPINTRKAYEEVKKKSQGPDWAYVVKTLLNEDKNSPGELNILADNTITFEDRIAMMPQYKECQNNT